MRQTRVLVACLMALMLTAASAVAAEEAAAEAKAAVEEGADSGVGIDLDEIDRVDDSIFAVAGETASVSADEFKPVEPVPPPPPAASEAAAVATDEAAAEASSEASADAALAADEDAATASSDAGADGRAMDEAAVGEDAATLFSFRAMAEATNAADSSVSEAADQTHKIARNYLKRSASADELFAEISREQQIFAAKRALVARQRATIADSLDSLKRLKAIVGENKQILKRNEKALKRASDDLLKLIASYQSKLKANVNSELGIDPAPTVAAFPLIAPVSKEAPKKKPAAPRKMRFAEASADVEDADESEADSESDAEESDSEQGWEWEYESDESAGEADADADADADAEAETETEADDSEAADSTETETEAAADADSAEEEGSAAALVETESYDPESPRVSVLPGLSAPPPLYNPATDNDALD